MDSKVKCTCGWSWNKSDSSKKDMYVCHNCGKDNTMKNGGWLDKFQDGGEKTYGTYQLPEVVVTPEPEEKGFWKQSIKSYLDENKDAGFLGALGSVVTYPLGLPQQAMMYGLTGKVQRPSEALGIDNPLGALASDIVIDPTNLLGVGVADDALKLSNKISKLFKEEKLLSKANKSKILLPSPNKVKIKNYVSSIKNNDDKIYHHLNMDELGSSKDFTKILPSSSDYSKWADEIYPGLSELISPDQLKTAHEKSIDYFKNSAVTGAGGKEHGLFIRNLLSDIIPQFRFPVVKNPEGHQVTQYLSVNVDENGTLDKAANFIKSDPLIQDLLSKSGYDVSKLTPQDWNIIDAYTKGYDYSINSVLRGQDRLGRLLPETKQFYKTQADLLKESVLKNKAKEPFQVTRGVGNYYVELLDPKTYQPLNKKVPRSELQKGDIFKDESFLSTAVPNELEPSFGSYDSSELIDIPGGNVQSIAIPEASSYPQYAGEREVILPPGLVRRVEETDLPGKVRFRTSILNPYSLTGILGGTAAASSNLKQKKNGGWLSKYDVPEAQNGIEGTMGGLTDKGFNYNGAWGGPSMQGGGKIFLEPTSEKLPLGFIPPSIVPSSEVAMSIGGVGDEPAYLIPSFKYGQRSKDPIGEFDRTGEHLGGPFKTYQEADEWERTVRHPYVEKGQSIPSPYRRWGKDYDMGKGEFMQMGGSIPGTVGFSYARTQSPAPSKGKYAKKTMASAQNGQEMKFYQEGLDWTPKTISRDGGWLSKYENGGDIIEDDRGQWEHPGEITKINSNEITMQGVDYPVLGISDTGDTQMMQPGQDYTYEGESVTEYPIMKSGGWLNKYAEGGEITEAPTEEYDIQEGDTLFEIARDKNIPLNTLANANKLENPDLIKTNSKLIIPKQYKKELKFEEIPTTDNKKIVIDNFSKHYDYIVEGDKTYYKTKSGKTWADISDNKTAQSNLLNFLDKNKYWGGYGSGEKELLKTDQLPKKQEVQVNLPKLTPINTKAQADATQVRKQLTKPIAKAEPGVFDDVTNYLKSEIDSLGIKSKKLQKELKGTVENLKNSVEEGIVKTTDGVEELLHVGINGIKRKFATHTGIDDDVEVKAPEINKPKTVSEYYGNKTGAEISAVVDVPDGSSRQFKQQVLPTSSVKFGVRNRGEYKDIKTDGLEVTTFHPFTKDKLPDNKTVIAVDSSGNLNVGKYKDFKDNKNFMWSPTTMNYVTDIATDKSGKIVYKKSEKNPGYISPVTNVIKDSSGKTQGSLNILVNKNKNGDYYGSVQGGRILVKNPDTNETLLISGSMNHIKSEFKRIKGNSKYLEVYNVDNGTYSRGLSYKDKKLTPERLKKYDEENLGGGGNGLYIMNYKEPVNKFKEEFVKGMPNIRTEKDESYKKGHPLKNEIKNIVLHHTAFTGPDAEKEVTAQYMTPGKNTSHIVIQNNGKRTIYASPEQVTFHAGESKWNNKNNVNDFSIGVEFQGDTNKRPLTQQQIESFVEYYVPIAKKYNLSLKDIVTHQMVAPGRKPDIAETEYQRILKYMKKNNLK